METTIKGRILLFIKSLGIGQRKFEINCELSNGYINNLKATPSARVLQKIFSKYPELNKTWLLSGDGKMISKITNQQIESNSTMNLLPLISIDAIAGFPTTDNDGISLEDCELYNVPEFVSKGAQYLIRVSGSSMYPNYNNGDILACRKIEDITFFQWGKVYVLDTNQGALVKRLFEDKDDNNNITCHSDNTDNYPDFVLPKSEIRSLSIVIGVIRIE